MLKDSNSFRGEWRLTRVSECYPDEHGKVRNVEIFVKPKQGSSSSYIPTKPIYLKRHVCNLIVIVPVEDQKNEADRSLETDVRRD